MMKCYELVLNHDLYLQSNEDESVPSFETLLDEIAGECEGFSGASLAGVARAAASHALERAVTGFSDASNREERGSGKSMLDCLVTKDDLQLAVQDVVSAAVANPTGLKMMSQLQKLQMKRTQKNLKLKVLDDLIVL
jgi:SpoVK/Ycf46/Vps4 family AAA+-type ATPase